MSNITIIILPKVMTPLSITDSFKNKFNLWGQSSKSWFQRYRTPIKYQAISIKIDATNRYIQILKIYLQKYPLIMFKIIKPNNKIYIFYINIKVRSYNHYEKEKKAMIKKSKL
jgi:hypothetical protein